MSEKTSKEAASAAARVLRDPNASKDAKSAAGSALTQREPERVADSEHAAFEAWIDQHPLGYPGIEYDAFVAGYRAAMQSQDWEDAERLDWMEEQAQTSRTGVSIDYVYDAQDGYVKEKGYRFMRHRFIGPLGKTAREAIDHARRIEGDGE